MMNSGEFPKKPFFSCTETNFEIADSQTAAFGKIEAWISLKCGPGNIFQARPRRVINHQGPRVSVECDDGVISLDFEEGTARKSTSDGDFAYMGGIDQGNAGAGYIPAG